MEYIGFGSASSALETAETAPMSYTLPSPDPRTTGRRSVALPSSIIAPSL